MYITPTSWELWFDNITLINETGNLNASLYLDADSARQYNIYYGPTTKHVDGSITDLCIVTYASTADPTVDPTANPTVDPTANPTVDPTAYPTVDPTANPTLTPTSLPTGNPTTMKPTIASPTSVPTKTNALCNSSAWYLFDDSWSYDETDCSLLTEDASSESWMWFGSKDGLTPNSDYSHESFQVSVTMKIDSGTNAGVFFRLSQTTGNVYPTIGYLVLINAQSDTAMLLSTSKGDQWDNKEFVQIDVDYGTVYTLSVKAEDNLYNVYLDGESLMSNVLLTNLTTGSIGLRKHQSNTTIYSVEYTINTPGTLCVKIDIISNQMLLILILLCLQRTDVGSLGNANFSRSNLESLNAITDV